MNVLRYIKYYFIKFKRLQGSPQALAGGTAIGVFVGLTPTMPLHTALIIFFSIITRTSALAGIIVSWIVCNPLTYLPIYYLAAMVGNHLTPYELNLKYFQSALQLAVAGGGIESALPILFRSGYEALIVMGVGGVCVGLPVGVISYYPALIFFLHIKKKRNKKHVLN